MFSLYENLDFLKKCFHLYFSPIEAYATVLRGSVLENAYDRIVYIVKKDINIFSKKGFLRGGTTFFFRADVCKKCHKSINTFPPSTADIKTTKLLV